MDMLKTKLKPTENSKPETKLTTSNDMTYIGNKNLGKTSHIRKGGAELWKDAGTRGDLVAR
jgi:hypothetical protein